MDLEGVHKALRREPFRPFVICLADGHRLTVTRPDSVAVGKRRAFVIGPDDSCSLIEPEMIVSLDLNGDHPAETNQATRGGTEGQGGVIAEQVRQLYNATPFRPFVIHLEDGRQIPVKHREFMAFSPSGRTIIVYQADDVFNIIDLLLMTDLKVKNGESPTDHH
jgi:hypothetical protein